MEPVFFEDPAAFRAWLEAHHASTAELWVGFHKKSTGRPSMTWPESVDEALCWGWIDGLRRSWDEDSYVIRFTPRRTGSVWSARNLERIDALVAEGRVAEPGRAAWERRRVDRTRRYSFEQDEVEFPPDLARRFRAERTAWRWFRAQSESYRKTVTWWVISAKREATRTRRLEQLIEDCAAGRRIKQMRRGDGTGG